MSTIPLDTSCQAEYSDGYILDETTFNDASPYVGGKNILNDILEKRPEAAHGRMVRFSVFYHDHRYDIDWTQLPDNARPIRFRDGFHHWFADGSELTGWSGCRMGYQFTDDFGRNVQEVRELR